MGFTDKKSTLDREADKFEGVGDNDETAVKVSVKNPDGSPLPVKITNAEASVTLNVDLDETEVLATSGIIKGDTSGNKAEVTSSNELKVEAIQKSGQVFNTNATIQNTSIDMKLKDSAGSNTANINSLGELSVSVQNSPSVSVSGTAEIAPKSGEVFPISASSAIPVSGTVSSNATIQNASIAVTNSNIGKTSYSAADVEAMSSLSLRDMISYYQDGVLSKVYNESYDSNSGLPAVSYHNFPEQEGGTKCLKRVRTFESTSPYQMKSEDFLISDWTTAIESAINPPLSLSAGTVTSPASDASSGTNVTTLTFSGGHPNSSAYTLTSSNSLYYLKVNSGSASASVTAQLTDTVTLCTNGDFSYSESGYNHTTTITLEDSIGLSSSVSVQVNTTQIAATSTPHSVTHAYNKDNAQHELRSPSNPWGSGNLGANKTWSYSFWIRTNSSGTGAYAVIGNAMDSSGTHQSSYFYLYRQGTGGELRLRMGNASNTVYPTSQSSHIDIFDNNWHHVVLTCDGTGSTTSHTTGAVGSNHKLYIDGVFQVASSETTGTIDYGSLIDKMVISRAVASVNVFEGYFAEVSFWISDLSSDADSSTGASSKIQSLYNSGKPTDLTSESGIYAWYRMGATTNDSGTASPWIQDATGNSTGLIPYPNTWSGTLGDSGAIHVLATTESIYVSGSSFTNTKYLDCNNETNKSSSFDQRMRTTPIFWDSSASATLFKPNGNWSVSFWFKYTDSSPYGVIWDMRNPDDTNKRLILYTGGSGNYLYLFARHGSGGDYAQENYGSSAKALLFDGSWHHVVITNAASSTSTNGTMGGTTTNMKLWIDGVCKSASGTDTMGDWSTTADNLRMTFGNNGTESLAMNEYYPIDHGLDNVSTWSVDLASDISGTSSLKISSLYNSGTATDLAGEAGLLNWFQCGETTGDNLYDASDATNAYLRDSAGTAKLIPETTTNGTTFNQGWSSPSYGTIENY